MDNPQTKGFAPHGNPHVNHPWGSRDYANIDCKAVGCQFNACERCLVPSRAKIGEQGQCEGFLPKADTPPAERTGD